MAKRPDLLKYQSLFIPASIFLGGLAVALAIIFTGGLGRISSSAGSPSDDTGNAVMEAEVSVDNDPGLGDPNAPLTMVEFSDYECPYCKSFFEETLPQIKSAYIDTGKVRFVLRDLPLPFHEPAASKEALAANCARDQGGDEKYFLYHDEIFARTASNAEGMKTADYAAAATKIGLNVAAFNSCLSTDKFKDEVAKDLADVTALSQKLAEKYPQTFQGIGTPTFIIGKTDSSGTFTGQVVSGAQPFASFQQVIDDLLK